MFAENIFDYVKPNKINEFELKEVELTRADAFHLLGQQTGDKVTVLRQGEDVVMSNTSMEKRTNLYFSKVAHGDVLIAGLGIGMILLEIQNKDHVKSITVVEKNSEVIELMKDLPLNQKVTIIHDDIFTWKPKGKTFDTIYFDIWNYINREVYLEMKDLKKRYRRCLKKKIDSPNSKMFCWAEYEAKNGLKLY